MATTLKEAEAIPASYPAAPAGLSTAAPMVLFDKLVVCGVGLIGGSFAMALREAAVARGVACVATYGLTEACSQVLTAGAPLFCTRVRIEDGEIAHPVEEITIAGNLRDMFRNVAAVGSVPVMST